ncbi:hypothetical protein [Priestia megaterium]|uniref:hypothetical protein n=1 Tax=Priestia megaterium TaxID=1404 RepID=UPI002E21553D|nr:hypothetical protein [Priestia megaterium]
MNKNFSSFKLKVDWKPSAYHRKTVRGSISNTLWNKIRLQVLEANNSTCNICKYTPIEKSELRNLHVHEIEEYGQEELVCTLKGLNLICKRCHAFHHIGLTFTKSSRESLEELIQHFMKVNNCTEKDYKNYMATIRKERPPLVIPSIEERMKNRDKSKTVKFFIDGDIPYKDEVISQLKKKSLYYEV